MSVPTYKVERILDSYNLVVVSDEGDVEQLQKGTTVAVLAIGPDLGNGVPLILPKAKLKISENLGAYAIAIHDQTEPQPVFNMLVASVTTRRVPLTVNEKKVAGNPANMPIEVGDVVVLDQDIKQYVLEVVEAEKLLKKKRELI